MDGTSNSKEQSIVFIDYIDSHKRSPFMMLNFPSIRWQLQAPFQVVGWH